MGVVVFSVLSRARELEDVFSRMIRGKISAEIAVDKFAANVTVKAKQVKGNYPFYLLDSSDYAIFCFVLDSPIFRPMGRHVGHRQRPGELPLH
jgi:hypothetical protein